MSASLTPATFEPHIGTQFSIESGDGEVVPTVLDSVERHPSRSHGERTEPFSLIFLGSDRQPLPQATYPIEHTDLGRLDIFIVPIGPDAHGRQRYEAVFN
jgi:uncharacterized protein DUF6916